MPNAGDVKSVLCSSCGEPTVNSYGLCGSCRAERTAGERAAQGLPVKVTDDASTAAWIAQLLLRRDRAAS